MKTSRYVRHLSAAASGACASVLALAWTGVSAGGHHQQHGEHAHHELTDEQFTELRQKVPLYREFSDQEIMANMSRMGPNFQVYLSDTALVGNVGVLALGHGYEPSGNEAFKTAYRPTAARHPTAVAFGMAMMTSDHIQAAVDELTGAGADALLIMPITTLEVGGLINQWRYIFGLVEEAPWMSVPRVQTDARIVFGPTPTTDPIISAILLDYAIQLSSEPTAEVVALVAHGPDNEKWNAIELANLEQHATVIRGGRDFADVRGFTLQDDAPTAVRAAKLPLGHRRMAARGPRWPRGSQMAAGKRRRASRDVFEITENYHESVS